MALALVMVGAGLGAMILPVVAQSIISRYGWRAAYASLGGLALLLGLPLSWRYIRECGVVGHKAAPVAHSGMTWQQGLRFSAFWIVTAILFVSSISMNGAITHLSALLTDRRITAPEVGLCPSLLGPSASSAGLRWEWLLTIFRSTCRACNKPDYRAGHFSPRSGEWVSFRAGLLLRSLASGPEAKPLSHLTC